MQLHTPRTWIEERFAHWRPDSVDLNEARFQRKAKGWFRRNDVSMRPDVSLRVPPKWRPAISSRRQAKQARRRLQLHLGALWHVLELRDPTAIAKDYFVVDVSPAMRPKETHTLVGALNLVLPWDDNMYWRVAWWYQRPTSHHTRLTLGLRITDIMELACEEPVTPPPRTFPMSVSWSSSPYSSASSQTASTLTLIPPGV